MYRDLISEIEGIEVNGRTWYYQQFNGWDGNLKTVNLYDEDGCLIAEFQSMEELEDFVSGVQ